MTYLDSFVLRHFRKCRLPVLLAVAFVSAAALADGESSSADSAKLPVSLSHGRAGYSKTGSTRVPSGAFATALGVYELDSTTQSVRFWQRSRAGLELLRRNNASSYVPSTATVGGGNRFFGVTPAGEGRMFKEAAGIAKHPEENKFAVVSGGDWVSQGSNFHCPSVQVYEFAETAGSDGTLSVLDVSYSAAYTNSFHETISKVVTEIASIEDKSYDVANLVTNSIVTNYVHVHVPEAAEELAEFLGYVPYALTTNSVAPEEALLIDHDPGSGYVDGMGWPYFIPKVYTNDVVHVSQFVTNYVTHYETTTNANYLSTATDVAFLGSDGIVVSVSGSSRSGVPDALVFFAASDPGAEAVVLPLVGLAGPVKGIDIDPDNGAIYAAVPAAAAVYKIAAPGGSAASWLSVATGTEIRAAGGDEAAASGGPVYAAFAGTEGKPGSDYPLLSNPSGVAVWKTASGDKAVLVADTANARVVGFNASGAALFYAVPASGDSLNNPAGVYGLPGEDVFLVADTGNKRSLVYDADLSGVEFDPVSEPATYAAVFTAMSPTNLSFRVWSTGGVPAAGDTVSLHASTDLSVPAADWPLATNADPVTFPVGADIAADGQDPREYGPVTITPSEDAVFYVIQQP